MTADELSGLLAMCAQMEEPEGDGSIVGRSFIVATTCARRVPALVARVRELEAALSVAADTLVSMGACKDHGCDISECIVSRARDLLKSAEKTP